MSERVNPDRANPLNVRFSEDAYSRLKFFGDIYGCSPTRIVNRAVPWYLSGLENAEKLSCMQDFISVTDGIVPGLDSPSPTLATLIQEKHWTQMQEILADDNNDSVSVSDQVRFAASRWLGAATLGNECALLQIGDQQPFPIHRDCL